MHDAVRAQAGQSSSIESWIELGQRYACSGRHREAIEAWSRATEADPTRVDVWERQIAGLLGLGDRDAAIVTLQRAVDARPMWPAFRRRLAEQARRAGRISLAAQHFGALAHLRPDDAEAWAGRAHALAVLGRHREASEAWGEARRCDPKSSRYALDSAEELLRAGRPADAIGALAVAADATLRGRAIRAWAALVTGDLECARQVLLPVAAELHHNPEALAAWAALWCRIGDPARALPVVETALRGRSPEDAAAWRALAGIRRALGQLDLAFQAAEQANRLEPGRFDVSAERARVSRLAAARHEPVADGAGLVFVCGLPGAGLNLVRRGLLDTPGIVAADTPRSLARLGDLAQEAGAGHVASLLRGTTEARGPGERILHVTHEGSHQIGAYLQLFRECRVVIVERDPARYAFGSFLAGAGRAPWATDLQHLGMVVSEEARAAARWAAWAPARVLRLRSEDVLARPEASIGDLRAFLGLPFARTGAIVARQLPGLELGHRLDPFFAALLPGMELAAA